MRVITGTARGRRLKTLDSYDVRPTTDKVKEAIFSIIHFDIDGSAVLDLFSGSGQMGIEALSRGAKYCCFVDKSKASADVTSENIEMTGFRKQSTVSIMDSLAYIKTAKNIFDIAILDPPYNMGLIEDTLPFLAEKMSDRGVVVCEHEKGLVLPEKVGKLVNHRTYRYGKVEVTVFRAENEPE
jgi:16S rRNA (guanine(966)-N(2))-methyltransferase RsmD